MRRLSYTHGAPIDEPCKMVLCDDDGTAHHVYKSNRAFNRIERHGAWWRLQGRDRETNELIYLREVEL